MIYRLKWWWRLGCDSLIWLLMNKWQREAVTEACSLTWGMHYADALIRRNGRDERHQADWLKFLADIAPRDRAMRWEIIRKRVKAPEPLPPQRPYEVAQR